MGHAKAANLHYNALQEGSDGDYNPDYLAAGHRRRARNVVLPPNRIADGKRWLSINALDSIMIA